ncbi:MAG: tyrosine phosphatase family protein [Beijerinckiaceae bacterium]
MPAILVCSLARLHDTVAAHDASHVATLINAATPVERPASIPAERHLFIGMSDITEAMDGHILPGESHVRQFLNFAQGWGARREKPMVVHCWAGISRSTAGAFIAACALAPDMNEEVWAQQIRDRSPTATPNARLVALADDMLGRGGRMVDAISAIGRGVDVQVWDGVPFRLDLPPVAQR